MRLYSVVGENKAAHDAHNTSSLSRQPCLHVSKTETWLEVTRQHQEVALIVMA